MRRPGRSHELPRIRRAAACRRLEILARVKNPAAKATRVNTAAPRRSMKTSLAVVRSKVQGKSRLSVPLASLLLQCDRLTEDLWHTWAILSSRRRWAAFSGSAEGRAVVNLKAASYVFHCLVNGTGAVLSYQFGTMFTEPAVPHCFADEARADRRPG